MKQWHCWAANGVAASAGKAGSPLDTSLSPWELEQHQPGIYKLAARVDRPAATVLRPRYWCFRPWLRTQFTSAGSDPRRCSLCVRLGTGGWAFAMSSRSASPFSHCHPMQRGPKPYVCVIKTAGLPGDVHYECPAPVPTPRLSCLVVVLTNACSTMQKRCRNGIPLHSACIWLPWHPRRCGRCTLCSRSPTGPPPSISFTR